jgi:hypothetical protein
LVARCEVTSTVTGVITLLAAGEASLVVEVEISLVTGEAPLLPVETKGTFSSEVE